MKQKHPALTLSFVLSYVALGGMAVLAVGLFPFLKHYISDYSRQPELASHLGIMLVLLYIALIIAAATVICLICLLKVVKRGAIFSESSLKLITRIALLVMLEAIPLIAMGYFFLLSLAVAYVALTIGICILVVRGILKEAIAIKSENDATI